MAYFLKRAAAPLVNIQSLSCPRPLSGSEARYASPSVCQGRGPIRNRGVGCTVEASGFTVCEVRKGDNSDWSVFGVGVSEKGRVRKGEIVIFLNILAVSRHTVDPWIC